MSWLMIEHNRTNIYANISVMRKKKREISEEEIEQTHKFNMGQG